MDIFKNYLEKIENIEHRERVDEILKWIATNFPNLKPKIAWNQPMFTDHETFIIAISVSKNHLSVSPEVEGIKYFSKDIIKSGYEHSKMLFKIKWSDEVDYSLFKKMIEFNIKEKAECKTFWRHE